jgi:hypothetical protein
MTDLDRVTSDLEFVKGAVHRAEDKGGPASIYLLWAALTLPGFAIIDFRAEVAGFYWMLAGPLGGLASAFLGQRQARRVGQVMRRQGTLHLLHWTAFMGSLLLLVPLVATGQLTTAALPRVIMILLALTYFIAGSYLEPRLRWVGLAIAPCYGLTFVLHFYPWTTCGLVMAASLVTAGLLGGRGGAAAS